VHEADPLGAHRVEPAPAGKESASVRLADLGDHERRDDRR
jgi:hypothetical protein